MVDLEKMKGKIAPSNPVVDFKSTAGAFAGDLLELAELQGKLFRADAKAATRQSMGSLGAVAISSCTLLGCLPVVVFGLASAVSHFCKIETWMAQLLVGGGFSLLSIVVAAFALKHLSRMNRHFQRSSEEFSKTIEWTKNVFSGDSSR